MTKMKKNTWKSHPPPPPKAEREKIDQSKRMAHIEFVFVFVWTIFVPIQIEMNAYCHNQRQANVRLSSFFPYHSLVCVDIHMYYTYKYMYVKNSISCFYFTVSILNFAFILHFITKFHGFVHISLLRRTSAVTTTTTINSRNKCTM